MRIPRRRQPAKRLVARPVHILGKRIFDTAVVIATAPLTIPVGVITAALVRINMGSPVFYTQHRVGLNEEVFSLLKFRSMLDEFDSQGRQRGIEERIPKFGHILRRSSLDELPQLINVLKGDMSLVGPRPLLIKYVPHYKDSERARHSVRPGITGAAQVSGRNHLGWDVRLKIDADYAREASFLDDLKILVKTVSGVFSSTDIAVPGDGADFLDEHRSYPREEGFALRRFEFRDIPSRVEWFNHPATLEYMTFGSAITEESTEKWLRQARKDPLRGDYVLCDEATDEPLAVVGYRFYDADDLPAIYIAVSPHQHGKGHGSRSTKLLLEHLKENLRLPGAYAELYRDNGASYKLWERLSMHEVDAGLPEGRVRMEIRWDVQDNSDNNGAR